MNDMGVVSPHSFSALRWWDWLHPLGRCRYCFFPRSGHPIRNFWAIKRPWGDTRKLSWGEAAGLELDWAVQSADSEEDDHC